VGYPERLGLAVFLGAPRVFGLLWRVVRVLLDGRTVSKARRTHTRTHSHNTRSSVHIGRGTQRASRCIAACNRMPLAARG
jgi:hypothetical protein